MPNSPVYNSLFVVDKYLTRSWSIHICKWNLPRGNCVSLKKPDTCILLHVVFKLHLDLWSRNNQPRVTGQEGHFWSLMPRDRAALRQCSGLSSHSISAGHLSGPNQSGRHKVLCLPVLPSLLQSSITLGETAWLVCTSGYSSRDKNPCLLCLSRLSWGHAQIWKSW